MPSKRELDLWVTSKEAAAILSEHSGHVISDSYVRRLGNSNKLSSMMVGGKTRLFNKAEVDHYVVKLRVKRDKSTVVRKKESDHVVDG